MNFYQRFGKRVIDIFGSMAALPLLGFSFILIAPIIKATDGGPVFFKGERRGLNGTHYVMYKYRTMRTDAEDIRNADGSTFNSNVDHRVTKTGRILRKTSIDELPQILNVLKGDMSFIGPRPNMTSNSWRELSSIEQERLAVRPGITGLAQARLRNSAPPDTRYLMDLEYIKNCSFRLDIRILIETIRTVITSKNVYSEHRSGEL